MNSLVAMRRLQHTRHGLVGRVFVIVDFQLGTWMAHLTWELAQQEVLFCTMKQQHQVVVFATAARFQRKSGGDCTCP